MLCVDEKAQIQALDRMQPVLPMRPGLPERRTHDYNEDPKPFIWTKSADQILESLKTYCVVLSVSQRLNRNRAV